MTINSFHRLAPTFLFAFAVAVSCSGCKSNQDNSAADPANASLLSGSDAPDPASANLASVQDAEDAQPAPSYSAVPTASRPTYPPQRSNGAAYEKASYDKPGSGQDGNNNPGNGSDSYGQAGNDQSGYDQNYDPDDYGEQAEETASEPPPPLPEYQQPLSPGDDYLWTPGYWSYSPEGYYWVPGVWVQAPYQGALWTPGWWGWFHGRFAFYRGYWGPHIGYYGGINYGCGYTGFGYDGGYWNNGRFYYNRSVNNININIVHNVYNRTVIVNNNLRVSYNGGQGGLRARPRPAELAAIREPHAAPMTTQIQNQRAASQNRAQFATANHGRPADVVVARPLPADRDVRPFAPPPARNLQRPPQAQPLQPRSGANQTTRPPYSPNNSVEPNRLGQAPENRHIESSRPESRTSPTLPTPPFQPITPQHRGVVQPRPQVQPNAPEPARPAPPSSTAPARPLESTRPPERPAPMRPQTAPPPHPQPPPPNERPTYRPPASAPRQEPQRQEPQRQERQTPREPPPNRPDGPQPGPKHEAPNKPAPQNDLPR